MNARKFFTGLSWLLLLNLLIKPAWIFLIDRQVQNAVGNEAYGRYFALFNLSYVLLFAADAGLTNLLTQRVATGALPNLRQLAAAKLFLLLVYGLLCLGVAWATNVTQTTWFIYLTAIQSLSSLYLFLRGLLTAKQLFKTDAVFSVLDKTAMLLLCAGPVYGVLGSIDVLLFLRLQLTATTISAASLLFLCFRKRLFISSAQKQSLFRLAKQTAPFLLIVLLMATHYRLDGFLLERLHNEGARQAGIYAAAYRLLDAGNMMGYLCASFLVPFIARHQKERKTVETVLLASRHGLMAAGILAATLAFVHATTLQQILYHTNGLDNSWVLALCLAVLPAYYLVHVYGSALTAIGELRLFIGILFFSVLTNLCLNLLFIPAYGAMGCCAAALISQYGCGLSLWLAASRKLSISYATKSALVYLFFAAICFALFSFSKNWNKSVWITLAVVGLCTALAAFTQKRRLKQAVSFLNS